MPDEKKSMIFYFDWLDAFEFLPAEKWKEMIIHVTNYAQGKATKSEDRDINFAFVLMKKAIDRNIEKYHKTVNRNKENGKKGGRPKHIELTEKPTGLNGNPKNPLGYLETQKNPKKPIIRMIVIIRMIIKN